MLRSVGPATRERRAVRHIGVLFSGRCTIVIIEETSESRPCFDRASAPSHALPGMNDVTVQSLMVSLAVVMFHILLDGKAKMLLSERDDLIQELSLD